MIEFLSWLRDAFTVVFFASVMLWCATHQFIDEIRELFASTKEVKCKKPAKKFNGSAATWVK